MLIALAVACALAICGWSLWLVCRRDLREVRAEADAAHAEAEEAHERARLADAKASAIRAAEASALDAQGAAEMQAKIAAVEMKSLRMALSLAEADRDALQAQVDRMAPAKGSDQMYDSATGKLRLYQKTRP